MKLLTVREAADMLGLHPGTMRKYLQNGIFQGVKIGEKGRWKIPLAQIEEFMEVVRSVKSSREHFHVRGE